MSDFLRDGELVYTLNERGTNEVYFAVYGPDRETEAERIRLALNSHAVLLAALEQYLHAETNDIGCSCHVPEECVWCDEIIKARVAVRAAIARARGGKS